MIKPKFEAELADIISDSCEPLSICGGNTRGMAGPGEKLSLSAMTGVELYEPGSLTLVAKAGTPLAEVETLLAAENQRLAFEPMDHRGLLGTSGEPTIGAVLAANISGSRRIQAGAARDFLLGVRFVDGVGQIVKNGGRVMKNVTGYDLVKLMAGAHGTLGVLTEVSLKVLPCAEAVGTVSVEVIDLKAAVATMSAGLGSPYDVTGAAYDPEKRLVYLRVEGFAGSVEYRLAKLEAALSGFGEVGRVSKSDTLWLGIRDVQAFHGTDGNVWRISVKPSDAIDVVAQLGALSVQFDWGGGLIWALMPENVDVRAKMTVPGHATLVRASEEDRQSLGLFQPVQGPLAAVNNGLRQKFDPRGILNPGLMG